MQRVREDFPILKQTVRGKPLVYLDNAASTQKPQVVIDAIRDYYEGDNANVHRGVHMLSERATRSYEEAREKVRRFLGAGDVARDHLRARHHRGHQSRGQQLWPEVPQARATRSSSPTWSITRTSSPGSSSASSAAAHLKVAPINDRGELILEEFEKLLSPRTKLVAVAHVSNTLGTVNPVRTIIELAHRRGVPVLLDGAQAVSHMPVDVQELDCDFYALSGHKIYGPTGVGVLYGKAKWLEQMPPFQGGGDMIRTVTFEKTTYNDLPYKFEAGHAEHRRRDRPGGGPRLPAESRPRRHRRARERPDRLRHESAAAGARPASDRHRRPPGRGHSRSCWASIHAQDVGTILDEEGIAVRTGHHCTMPLMERFGVPATVRAALAFYNTHEEIDALVRGLNKVKKFFA